MTKFYIEVRGDLVLGVIDEAYVGPKPKIEIQGDGDKWNITATYRVTPTNIKDNKTSVDVIVRTTVQGDGTIPMTAQGIKQLFPAEKFRSIILNFFESMQNAA